MKKLICILISFLIFNSLFSQSNNLIITGQVVYEEAPNPPAAFQTVTINGPILNNPIIVQTGPQGFYEAVIVNGSVIGPNQVYTVSVINCNNQTLTQQVSNQQGTVDFATVNFQICGWQGGCEALFTISNVPGNSNAFIFDASQSVGNELTYTWNFGNGVTASGAVVTQVFEEAGEYQVCLNVNDSYGFCSNTYCDSVVINASSEECEAFFIWQPSFIYAGQAITFINQNMGANSCTWQVNNEVVSNDVNLIYTFSQPGSYLVCLSISGQNGCEDQFCATVTVSQTLCNSNFGLTVDGQMITATPQLNNTDDYQFVWQLHHPNGSVQTYTHSYPFVLNNLTPGDYLLCLTVQIPGNFCSDTTCQLFVIDPPLSNACSANISFSPNNDALNSFTFESSIPNGNGFSNEWFIENSVYSTSTVTHSFSQPGVYEVCLVVSNDDISCIDTTCVIVTVQGNNNPCNIGFTVTQTSPAALTYGFAPTGISVNTTQLIWNFGDGNTSSAFSPEHNYAASGIYNVCLNYWTTINGAACEGVICQTITVGTPDTTQISTLGGVVYAGNNLADFGFAYLIRFDSPTNTLNLVALAAINNGQFQFPDVAPGEYLLKAALDNNSVFYANYLPTYFGDVLYWEDALSITVLPGTSQLQAINLIFGSNQGGPGFVSGNVDDGANRLSQFAANPVAMADIILLDANNMPQMWTRANHEGSYSLSNIAFGTYRLFADVPGIKCIPIEFTISEDFPSLEIDIVLGDGLTFVVKNEQVVKVSQLYPNPATELSILNISNPDQHTLMLQVFDLQGRLMKQIYMGNSFEHQIVIPVSDLMSGIYQIVIRKNGTAIATRKLVVTRP
ncbi:MAG: PKD domain-containing protein [Flavobacteriales bacterium]